ncbi:Nif3-like dinuclear metal center hexameric protein [Candidatus Magnetaquicoccus inordinatus]|uniref:Nif3-like dinuclear metal center hexameric protein n=1 Tax=Candidatus Magnetaquicoccus inordinatus TaxID=2496818 RepID=UPI00102D206C|nr:Nif3-like dinuclear metal center hexameric protein [Candidatus Magnetaquicoccus inordinatus]
MVTLTELERYCHTLLNSSAISDYAPNGVQVRGREEIHTVVTGVSACLALFEEAIALNADLVLVHHGMFWEKDPRIIEGSLKKRLQKLLQQDLTLMAFHLPLDAHPSLGNNAQILQRLQLTPGKPFALYRGTHLSAIGECAQGLSIEAMSAQVQELFGGQPLLLPYGPTTIHHVAVCSGAAPELIREAKQKGADLFLTGEASEYVTHFAAEEEIHFIAAGHHRTEKFGVQALGEALAKQFALQHHFVDIANPI